ncbi:response regulator [Aquisalinus flavus]|uniref:Response regulator n=1 Tax=Aquisalinus flavus TaxID=1526572 RepID=A0A8J2Y4T1_9PROT|nr:response regulator [Aquisalinus flavus]MBD0427562.1 response regulator [Aquisalinus flavus]GGD01932.1 response regulator [Aquisalinus flavus]
MKTCLIVEDSETVRHILTQLVEAAGYHTLQAANAAEALDVTSAARPEIVFLDWDLPGLEALDYLRGAAEAGLPDAPHIVLCAMENDAQQFALAKSAGARFHMIKPYDKRDVRSVLGLIEQQEKLDLDDMRLMA